MGTFKVFLMLGALLPFTSGLIYNSFPELEASRTVFDFIIIGGGTAGAVVANRLTERKDFNVLVIEAGPTNVGVLDSMVPAFPTDLFNTVYDWNYTTVPGIEMNNRSISYPRGHILGGCSSHNAMFYTRGSSDDYNRFADVTGDPGWSWDNILPYMLNTERWSPPADHHNTTGEFDPSVHGFNGLLLTSLPGFPQPSDGMVLTVPEQLPEEFPFLLDHNAGKPIGLGWYQGTIGNGTRSSSATACLSSQFTGRSNLHLVLNTKVSRILSDPENNLTFSSVEISGSQTMLTATKEIILSAGPINTPHLLLNSGIGDSKELSLLGIPTILNLPSVGKNLSDQPFISISYTVSSNNTLDNLHNNATLQAEALAQWLQNRTGPDVNGGPNQIGWTRLSTDFLKDFNDPSAGPNTPHIELTPSTGGGLFSTLVGHFISMGIIIVTPASRGTVTLSQFDPTGHPLIDLGFLSNPFDLAALKQAIKISQRFFEAPIWKGYIIEQVVPPANTTSDSDLDDFIRSNVFSTQHGVGTAAMSSRDAAYGVVNPDLLVKGAKGLRIVDGSVLVNLTSCSVRGKVAALVDRSHDIARSGTMQCHWGGHSTELRQRLLSLIYDDQITISSMLHFPAKLQTNVASHGVPKRTDSLNATQQLKSATAAGANPLFLQVEEELHDARRVHADGQEDDLRYALNMVINRVSNLSSLLSEAYKTQADLEVQLNVAKSNLQLVIANNEMLEDALRRDTSGQAKDVGWRRSSARDSGGSSQGDPRSSLERSQSVDYPLSASTSSTSVPPSPPSASSPAPSNAAQDNRFFKFRFTTSTNNVASQPSSRIGSTNGSPQVQAQHLTSPSLPSLTNSRSKEVEDLEKELQKEKLARKKITDAKTALEEELESLSQALFEEANKMVATERKLRADAEEELNELKREKEALRSALVLVEGENTNLRLASPRSISMGNSPLPSLGGAATEFVRKHTRSASEIAVKSRPTSLDLNVSPYPPLPPSPAPSSLVSPLASSAPITVSVLSPSSAPAYDFEDAQPTPRSRVPTDLPSDAPQSTMEPTAIRLSRPIGASSSTPIISSISDYAGTLSHVRSSSASSLGVGLNFDEPSPWADVPSRSRSGSPILGSQG